ncbi:MAG: ABC transporter substrate-binding protein [Oscillospiraceae bacterium]|jgi:branched-chain amino acid transport system substrate-binding protein
MKISWLKKIVSISLALAMLLFLVACNGATKEPGGETGAPGGDSTPSASDKSPAPAPDGSTSPGEKTDVLKIGVLINLTGWFSVIDANNKNEITAYANMLNEEGGVKIGDTTYTVELVFEDGQSDATGIRNAAQLLVNSGCKYVIETNDFWVESAMDIFEKNGIMNMMAQNNMSPATINPDLKYSFTFCNGAVANYDAAFQAIKDLYPEAKTVIHCQNDDGQQEALQELMREKCEKYGFTYIDEPVIYDASATDFSAIALQIIKTGADIFMGNGQPANVASILKEVRNNGSDQVFAPIIGMPAASLMEIAGIGASTRVFSESWDLSTEANCPPLFWKIYQKYVEDFGAESAASMGGNFSNTLYVLLNLMQGCGSIDVGDVIAYWDTLETVDTIYGTGIIGGKETYGVNHLVAHPTGITYLVDGKQEFGGIYDTIVP